MTRLVMVPLIFGNRSFSVVYHKNRKLPEYAEKFIEIVKENKEFNILEDIKYGILS